MGMVDVSDKEMVERIAIAEGRIKLKEESIKAIKEGRVKKGDVFCVAESAALLAIKNTFLSIPHCHPIPVESASLEFFISGNDVICRCEVKARYKTGVEMEALHGVVIALLTIWDMVKYMEKDERGGYPFTVIHDIKVIEKRKGE